jgi:hypothetical protein
MTKVSGKQTHKLHEEVIHLGNDQTAFIRRHTYLDAIGAKHISGDALKLAAPSTYESDGGYCPAESFTVSGERILALRDFLNLHYPPEKESRMDLLALLKEAHATITIEHGDAVVDQDALHAIPTYVWEKAKSQTNHIGKFFYEWGFSVVTTTFGMVLEIETKEGK